MEIKVSVPDIGGVLGHVQEPLVLRNVMLKSMTIAGKMMNKSDLKK